MNVEDELRTLKRREPEPSLDARMDRLFDDAAARAPRFWARPVALWQCVAACVVCALIASLAVGRAAPPVVQPTATVERTVYFVETDRATITRLVDAASRSALGTPGMTPETVVREFRTEDNSDNGGGSI